MTGLVIPGRVARADVPELCERARALLAEGGRGEALVCDVGALTETDATTVGALARIQLTARRMGREVQLANASVELRLLVDLCGLSDVLPFAPALRGQAVGQPEQREQPLGVEERVQRRDPPV